jgi:hypothetical protein
LARIVGGEGGGKGHANDHGRTTQQTVHTALLGRFIEVENPPHRPTPWILVRSKPNSHECAPNSLKEFSCQAVGEICPRACPSLANAQESQPTTIPTTDTAIAAVEAQPSQRNHPTMVNFFMIFRWAVMIIMTIMTGTATTPLITALQYNALMGSRGVRVMPIPSAVAALNIE